jgi:hypothetical protein
VKTNLQEIKRASQCLRYNEFYNNNLIKSDNLLVRTINSVIQKAYLQVTETEFRCDWRRIIGWVDKEVFRDIDIEHTESWTKGKTNSEHILMFLRKWYEDIYMNDSVHSFADFALEAELSGHIIQGRIPLLKLQDPPTILYATDVVRREAELYNDISVRGMAWLVMEALECERVSIQELAIGSRGGYNSLQIQIDSSSNSGVTKMLAEITGLIAHAIDYPSVTEQCNTCPFRKQCVI